MGFSEIDKYASAVYKHRFPNAEELGDVNLIQPERLPDHIDFVCGGFPCQAFSQSGLRKGFKDTRGTLFFEIARILRYYRKYKKPIDYFVLENVKGLLSHDNGRTFATIYRVLTDIGYTVEFQLLNTRWFLPQNRERIYLVGYIGSGRGSKVFPIGEERKAVNGKQRTRNAVSCIDASYYKGVDGKRTMIAELNQIGTIGKDSEATRVYDSNGLSRTIKYGGGMGAKTGLYKVGDLQITAKKRSHDTPKEINEYLKANKHGKTIQDIATNLSLPKTQVEHYFRSDKYRAVPSPEHWLLLKEYLGFDDTYDKHVTEIYEKEVEFEASRRVYSSDGISKTLDTHESGYYQVKPKINIIGNLKGQDGHECHNVHSSDGIAPTVRHNHGKVTMVKPVITPNRFGVQITEATKKGYKTAYEGDSVNIQYPQSSTRKGRVGKQIAQTIDTAPHQCVVTKYNYSQQSINKTLEKENLGKNDVKALDLYNHKAQDIAPTLTEPHHNSLRLYERSNIRRLTPTECERLQGFPDGWTSEGVIDGKVVKMSDTQRYKQCGNAVTVNVVQAVAERLRPLKCK